MKPGTITIKKVPTCLAELDFEILCKTRGKEVALRTFQIISAIRKEKLAKRTTN